MARITGTYVVNHGNTEASVTHGGRVLPLAPGESLRWGGDRFEPVYVFDPGGPLPPPIVVLAQNEQLDLKKLPVGLGEMPGEQVSVIECRGELNLEGVEVLANAVRENEDALVFQILE